MKRGRLPVRAWLTLWSAGILGVALIALGVAVRVTVHYYLLQSVDNELRHRAVGFLNGMPHHGPPPGEPRPAEGDDSSLMTMIYGGPNSLGDIDRFRFDGRGDGGRPFQQPRERTTAEKKDDKNDRFFPRFFDRDGKVQDRGDRDYSLWDVPGFSAALAGDPTLSTVEDDGENIRVYSVPMRRPNESISGVVQLSFRLADIERGLAAVDRTLLALLPLALLITVSGGVLLTNRAIRPIEQALEQEKRFVADASHELRTPLSIIKTAAELGLETDEEDEGRDPVPILRRALERVTVATERTQRIVEDLMLLARAESVRSQPEGSKAAMLLTVEPVLARDFLDDAACLFDPIRGNRTITVEVTTKNLVLWLDQHHMGRVLSNLIDNAVRHTDSERGAILLAACAMGSDVVITVSDNGEGIPAADVPNIFRRFYRPDASRVRTKGGSGLGLSIAKAVVEAHGGGIAIESVEGAGTVVRMHLPMTKNG